MTATTTTNDHANFEDDETVRLCHLSELGRELARQNLASSRYSHSRLSALLEGLSAGLAERRDLEDGHDAVREVIDGALFSAVAIARIRGATGDEGGGFDMLDDEDGGFDMFGEEPYRPDLLAG